MFRIAVCDDDEMTCNSIEDMINDYVEVTNTEITVDVYYSAISLMSRIKESDSYDLIFLDIEMGELSGIEFGRRLRDWEQDELTKIVFISNKESYAMNLFRIRPIDFLKKPVHKKDVFYNIEKSIELLGKQKQCFLYHYEHTTIKLPAAEILYFESSNRVVIAHTTKGEVRFYEKLGEVMKRLDKKYFWRIHKSYLIHIAFVKRFEYTKVLMDNGKELPISQSYRAMIRKQQRHMMGKGY